MSQRKDYSNGLYPERAIVMVKRRYYLASLHARYSDSEVDTERLGAGPMTLREARTALPDFIAHDVRYQVQDQRGITMTTVYGKDEVACQRKLEEKYPDQSVAILVFDGEKRGTYATAQAESRHGR